jgi:hypothetical protein
VDTGSAVNLELGHHSLLYAKNMEGRYEHNRIALFQMCLRQMLGYQMRLKQILCSADNDLGISTMSASVTGDHPIISSIGLMYTIELHEAVLICLNDLSMNNERPRIRTAIAKISIVGGDALRNGEPPVRVTLQVEKR